MIGLACLTQIAIEFFDGLNSSANDLSERVEKYNQFIRIEEELAGYAKLARFPAE